MLRDISTETWAITGAAGRIGSTLRAGLAGSVARLVLIDHREVTDAAPHESAIVADLADPASLRAALGGVDGVIHLAAVPDEADFHDLVEANVVGSFHLLEAARQAGVTRIVYASTGRTIGMYDVHETVTPSMRPRPDGLYAAIKVAGEALCSVYVDKFGFTATCLRIGAFKPAPEDARDLSVWLSPADAVRAALAAMRRDDGGFEVLLTYSANTDSWVDLGPGRALGFDPLDDARALLSGDPVTTGPQAGHMADPEFTLERQRPF
jgi:uronate dehydrogenase